MVFLYLVTGPFDHDLRAFVQRQGDLFRALPGWTLRVLVRRRAAGGMESLEAAVRDELTAWSPRTVEEFTWYCEQRRTTSDPRARCQSDERFGRAHRAFSTSRGQRLYHRWVTDGDTVFEGISSPAIAEALDRGTARIESQVLLLWVRPSLPLGQPRAFVTTWGRGGSHTLHTASTPCDRSTQRRRRTRARLVPADWPLLNVFACKDLPLPPRDRWGGVLCRP